MHYVRVTRHGRIIVLQSETPTHIIAASTTTEQDVGARQRCAVWCVVRVFPRGMCSMVMQDLPKLITI
jgi:hypothetical protein